MRCELAREAVSAALDGEDPGGDLAEVLRHQVGCAGCAAWVRSWQGFGRRVRLTAAEPVPDLTESILAAVAADRVVASRSLPRETLRRRLLPTRLALVAVALAQLLATWPSLLLGHDHAAPEHLARELGSFGVAVTLGLLVAAAWPSLAAGSLPVLAASGGLLAVTAGLDIAAGRAAATQELPHLLPTVGVLLLAHLALAWTPPRDDDRDPRGELAWRLRVERLTGLTRRRTAGALARVAAALPAGGHLRHLRHLRQVRVAVRRLVAATVVAAGLGLVAAVPASAHASLETSTPQSGSVADAGPRAVRLHFDEPVNVPPDGLKVVGPDGRRVDEGPVRHPGGQGSDVAVDVRSGLADGSYLVAYRVVSADSHPISGAYAFSVGAPSATADPSALQTTSNGPLAWLLGAGRFLTYSGLVLLLGGVAFLLACWPGGWSQRRPQQLVAAGWASVVAGTAVGLVAKGAYDAGGGFGDVARLSLMREVLGTPFGRALGLRIAVLALLLLWWPARTSSGRSRGWLGVGAALGAVLLWTFARAGHANAGGQRVLATLSDALHLIAMSVWLGGLAMLALMVLRPAPDADPAAAVSRFSRIAAGCVLALVATGTYQSWRQVGELEALPETTYGRLLLVKVGLVSMVLLAAAASRSFVRRHYAPLPVVHASVDGDVAPTATADGDEAASAPDVSVLRRSVGAEAVLATIVLAVTAALVSVQPARTAYRPSFDETLRLGPLVAEVTGDPVGERQMDVHVYTSDRAGNPVDPAEVTAKVSLPAQNLGPLTLGLESAGPGHQTGVVDLPVRGDWRFTVSARTTEIDVYTKAVTVAVR